MVIHGVLVGMRFHVFESAEGPRAAAHGGAGQRQVESKPTKADILAQANLEGGGNTDADRRAKSPLPVLPNDNPKPEIAAATQRVETLERRTRELLTSMKGAPVAPAAAPTMRRRRSICRPPAIRPRRRSR